LKNPRVSTTAIVAAGGIGKTALVLDILGRLIYDVNATNPNEVTQDISDLSIIETPTIIVANKMDASKLKKNIPENHIQISAKNKENIHKLKEDIYNSSISNKIDMSGIIVTNERHYNLLQEAKTSLENIVTGLETQLPADLIAMDIRQASISLGEITGTITTDDLLGNIFGKFCIGK